MSTGDDLPLWGRVWLGLGLAIPVLGGLAAAALSDDGAFRLAGACLAAGTLAAVVGLRVGTDAAARARSDGDGILLPRRWLHGAGLAVACAAFAVGAFAGAAIEVDPDSTSSPRGEPGLLIVFGPPFAVAAVLLAGGTLLGRGRLRIGPSGVRYTRIARAARWVSWEDLREARLIDNDSVLRIDRSSGHIRVPLAGQRWPGPTLVGMLNHYRHAGASERRALTDPAALDREPQPGRSQAPGD